MARNQLMRILSRSDKGASRAHGVGGVLSRLWSQILKDRDVNIARWNDYMHSFVTDPRNGIAPTRKDQTSARGNLTKEFSRPQMTWKVFMKALRFLKALKVEIAIKIHYPGGFTSTHGTEVNFGTPVQLETTFMEDISRQTETEPEVQLSAEEDAQNVYEFLNMLANPFMFPFGIEDAESEDEAATPDNPQGSRIYRAWATDDDFGGSLLARQTYNRYLADTREMDLDHEHREQ
jgi:hypothetical protein